jgi:hypothetical protein
MMQYLAGSSIIEKSAAFILKAQRQIQVFGYGRWACSLKKSNYLPALFKVG